MAEKDTVLSKDFGGGALKLRKKAADKKFESGAAKLHDKTKEQQAQYENRGPGQSRVPVNEKIVPLNQLFESLRGKSNE
jgi:hypothetical protein